MIDGSVTSFMFFGQQKIRQTSLDKLVELAEQRGNKHLVDLLTASSPKGLQSVHYIGPVSYKMNKNYINVQS